MNRPFFQQATFVLFLIVLAELVIGGGGRLFVFGPLTLRMILFAMAMFITLIHVILGEKLQPDFRNVIIAFVIVYLIAIAIGILNGAERKLWWEDIRPLLYIFMLSFFYFSVKRNNSVSAASTVIKAGSLVLAFTFFICLVLIHSGVIPFLDFYNPAIASTEFFFRGELTFFYKGFLFLCVGFIFYDFAAVKSNRIWQGLLLIAIILTFTRGFLFALALTYSVYYFLSARWWKTGIALAVALLVAFSGKIIIEQSSLAIYRMLHEEAPVPITESPKSNSPDENVPSKPLVPSEANTDLLGDRAYSDRGRKVQIQEVWERTTPVSFLIGHGLGNGIPSRPVHMEISYLEIFHKQGMIGMCFWGWILFLLLKKYKQVSTSRIATAFFLSSVFVFFQSLTNQYINNPIGLSVILLSLVVLDFIGSSRSHIEPKSP